MSVRRIWQFREDGTGKTYTLYAPPGPEDQCWLASSPAGSHYDPDPIVALAAAEVPEPIQQELLRAAHNDSPG